MITVTTFEDPVRHAHGEEVTLENLAQVADLMTQAHVSGGRFGPGRCQHCAEAHDHAEGLNPRDCEGCAPVERHRCNAAFLGTKLLLVDVDDGMKIQEAMELVKHLRFAILPSKSHQREKRKGSGKTLKISSPCDRFHLVIELAEEITDEATYRATWEFARDVLGLKTADKQAKDVARFFTRAREVYWVNAEGELLAPVKPQPRTTPGKPAPKPTTALARVADVEPLADPTVMKRARAYVARMPDAVSGEGGHTQTLKVAQVFVRGFNLPDDAALTLLREYNERLQENGQETWTEEELAHKIQSARTGNDKSMSFGALLQVDDKIEGWNPGRSVLDVSDPDARHPMAVARKLDVPLVVLRDRHFWILEPRTGNYGPPRTNAKAVLLAARQIWQIRDLPPGELQSHTESVNEVRYSLGGTRPTWDHETRVITMPRPGLRPLSAKFDGQVDRWLNLIEATADGCQFVRWVASVPCVEEPTSALAVVAPGGFGKELLANGLSRLWTEGGPVPFDVLGGDFNEELLRCPLLFADESLPNWRDKSAADVLRSIITKPTHSINPKGGARATAFGYARAIAGTNNEESLHLGKELNSEDVRALAERLTLVGGRSYEPKVRAVIEFLANIQATQPGELNTWVTEDRIARHALWLRDREGWATGAKKTGRFIVPGNGERSGELLAFNDPLSVKVLSWVFHQVLNAPATKTSTVRVARGKVWLRASTLTSEYDLAEDITQATRVLGKLAPGESEAFKIQGKVQRLRGIDLGFLRRFAERHDLDVEGFEASAKQLLEAWLAAEKAVA
jgi:hypothetical protein